MYIITVYYWGHSDGSIGADTGKVYVREGQVWEAALPTVCLGTDTYCMQKG